MLSVLTTWLYDEDPLMPLYYEAPLAAIKEALNNGESYFENLISTYLLNNTHRTTVVLEPDPELRQRQEAAETERLAQARAEMSEADLQAVMTEAQRLKELQEKPDSPAALASLPRLELTDLDKENKTIPIAISTANDSQLLYHDLFTNGIVYLDVGFNLHALPQDLLPYFSIFSQALLQVGTETEDFVKLSQRIGRKTGGIRPSTLSSAIKDESEGIAWFFLRGKATLAQTDDLLAILRDVLLTVNLDNPKRIKQIILEEKSGKEASLIPGGHGVVSTRLGAKFNEIDWADEQMHGLEYLFFLRKLVDQVEQDWPAVLAKLEEVRRILINRQAMLCNITVDEASWQEFEPKLNNFITTLPAATTPPATWTPSYGPGCEGLTIPAQVNYVGKGANLYQLGYELHGSAAVISNYLRTTWLWEKVRVQGGAYGGFCSFDQQSGIFKYLSYRDPNLLGTLDNYDQTAQFLRNLDLSQDELTKSIIGTIGSMDAYQLPDAKGYTSMVRHLVGISDERRQELREQVLGTTTAHFKAFGEALERLNEQGLVVVLGAKEAIEKANAERGGSWLSVKKVL
jgi:Zn-dependent M16 (insulinase) family peptidase